MSGNHDHSNDHADAHDDDHHEEAPLPEPETPLWFTGLGGILFLVAGLAFLISTRDDPDPKQATARKPMPMPTVRPRSPRRFPAPRRLPHPHGNRGGAKPRPKIDTKELIKRMPELRRKLNADRKRRGLPPLPTPKKQ